MTFAFFSYARVLGAETRSVKVLPLSAFARAAWCSIKGRHVVEAVYAERPVICAGEVTCAAGGGTPGSAFLNVTMVRDIGSRGADPCADPLLYEAGAGLWPHIRLGDTPAKGFDACASVTAPERRYAGTPRENAAASASGALLAGTYQNMFGGSARGRFGRLFRDGVIESPTNHPTRLGVPRDAGDEQWRTTREVLAPRYDEIARSSGVLPLARQGNMARV